MAGTHYLWVEGVDFDATVFDTSDLSTVRGAGLTLYELGTAVKASLGDGPELIFSGASQAAFRLSETGADKAEALVAAMLQGLAEDATFGRMSITHGLAEVRPDGDENAALKRARARALGRRQRRLSVPNVSLEGAKRPCEFDRLRGAEERIWVGEDRYWASPSVIARREHGRNRRQTFYQNEGGLGPDALAELFPPPKVGSAGKLDSAFTDSFDQLVADPPDGVPEAVQGKMAVIYLDGNGFTKLIMEMAKVEGSLAGAYAKLSEVVKSNLSERLLKPLLNAFAPDIYRPAKYRPAREYRPARLETLLWGGDEVTFVVPAWKALEVAAVLTEALSNPDAWTIDVGGKPRRLTFGIGMVIAHHKTPIRLLKAAAQDLAEAVKKVSRDKTQIAIEVLESLDIPAEGIVAARRKSLGLAEPESSAPESAASEQAVTATPLASSVEQFYALDGAKFANTVKALETRKKEIPASQIHRWLYLARDNKRFAGGRSQDVIQAAIDDYSTRIQDGTVEVSLDAGDHRPLAWDLFLIKTLWDYLPLEAATTEAAAPTSGQPAQAVSA